MHNRCLLLLLLILLVAVKANPCFYREDCQNYGECGSGKLLQTVAIMYFGDLLEHSPEYKQFQEMMSQAALIAKRYGASSTLPKSELHSSMKYFCCYSEKELLDIALTIRKYEWEPFSLSFDHFGCDGFNRTKLDKGFDIEALLDKKSHVSMQKWIADLEAFIESEGIPIHKPRSKETPFHSSLASVATKDIATFDFDGCLKEMDELLPLNSSLTVDWFLMENPPFIFYANNTVVPDVAHSPIWKSLDPILQNP